MIFMIFFLIEVHFALRILPLSLSFQNRTVRFCYSVPALTCKGVAIALKVHFALSKCLPSHVRKWLQDCILRFCYSVAVPNNKKIKVTSSRYLIPVNMTC